MVAGRLVVELDRRLMEGARRREVYGLVQGMLYGMPHGMAYGMVHGMLLALVCGMVYGMIYGVYSSSDRSTLARYVPGL